ncbi:MAG: hypothetical protein CBD11_00915 [Phycisphaera sp. TMED151]|nr:MAG: hypothetical protein CBD11_00915 [Phycisphaera sp. TMED151]
MIDNALHTKKLNMVKMENIVYMLNELEEKKRYTDDDVKSLFVAFGEAANKKVYPHSIKDSGAVMLSEILREGVYSNKYIKQFHNLFETAVREKDKDTVFLLLKIYFRRGFVYWAFNLPPENHEAICDTNLFKDIEWQLWLQKDADKRRSCNCKTDVELLHFIQEGLNTHYSEHESHSTVCSEHSSALIRNFSRRIIDCGQTSPRVKKIVNKQRGWINQKAILAISGGLLLVGALVAISRGSHKGMFSQRVDKSKESVTPAASTPVGETTPVDETTSVDVTTPVKDDGQLKGAAKKMGALKRYAKNISHDVNSLIGKRNLLNGDIKQFFGIKEYLDKALPDQSGALLGTAGVLTAIGSARTGFKAVQHIKNRQAPAPLDLEAPAPDGF